MKSLLLDVFVTAFIAAFVGGSFRLVYRSGFRDGQRHAEKAEALTKLCAKVRDNQTGVEFWIVTNGIVYSFGGGK